MEVSERLYPGSIKLVARTDLDDGAFDVINVVGMEAYLPGRTENLHDYLIPTCGDMPKIKAILIEDPEPLGPYGAKGVGEHSLIATAPAILGGIYHATGVRIREVPARPDHVRAAILRRSQNCDEPR